MLTVRQIIGNLSASYSKACQGNDWIARHNILHAAPTFTAILRRVEKKRAVHFIGVGISVGSVFQDPENARLWRSIARRGIRRNVVGAMSLLVSSVWELEGQGSRSRSRPPYRQSPRSLMARTAEATHRVQTLEGT